jgi:hypothetical protein
MVMSTIINRIVGKTEEVLRRAYIRAVLPIRVSKMQKTIRNGGIDFNEIKRKTLEYVASNQIAELGIGYYSYRVGGPSLVYASAYAALVRHLYGDLKTLTVDECKSWAQYLLQNQSEDGLFRDPQIECHAAEEIDWWGWRHMTMHVLMALCALGAKTYRTFECIKQFKASGRMAEWLANRNWEKDATCVSNEVQNYGTLLQYARDFQDQSWCQAALDEMYDWLDDHQNAETGCWGYPCDTPLHRSYAVQTGYHFWCMYFYDNRPIKYIERIIDTCLATQNKLGGFGVQLNSSACEDIDSIDPLVRLSFITDYRRAEIISALKRAIPWILVNQNKFDGGWVFRRYQLYNILPHRVMWAGMNESFMTYTWFRTLSLAYIAQALPDSNIAELKWHFEKFPYIQFWIYK